MDKIPIVSIIIPVYNAELYIIETINSALASTYSNIEIICIDDHSTDNSISIIEEHFSENKKIQLIKLITNSKPSFARNIGIKQSIGKYILPLDADDLIDNTYIEKAVKILENKPDISVVYSRFKHFGYSQFESEFSEHDPDKMVVYNCVCSSGIYRKVDWQYLGGYNEDMKLGYEDWDFWLNFVEAKKKFFCINEVLFYYRIHCKSRNKDAVTNDIALRKTIKKNHKKLYSIKKYFFNPYLRSHILRSFRRSLFRIKTRKNERELTIFGICIYKENKSLI